jgi:hypothetical protein
MKFFKVVVRFHASSEAFKLQKSRASNSPFLQGIPSAGQLQSPNFVHFVGIPNFWRAQQATMPEAILPVRCMFRIKTGAFYGQEAAPLRKNDVW